MTKKKALSLGIIMNTFIICGIKVSFTQDDKDKNRWHARFKCKTRDELRDLTNALKVGLTYKYIMKATDNGGCYIQEGFEGHGTTTGDTLIRRFWHDSGWVDAPYKAPIVEEYIPDYTTEDDIPVTGVIEKGKGK